MTISQAILWAATNTQPEEKSSRDRRCRALLHRLAFRRLAAPGSAGPRTCRPTRPRTSTSGAIANMSTVKGLFCAGDASGASSHKFSSGSHAEGRIAAKAAIKFIMDNNTSPTMEQAAVDGAEGRDPEAPGHLREATRARPRIPRSTRTTSGPRMFMFRLQKIMDEYAGGVSAQFTTNEPLLNRALELLEFLKEDAEKLAAAEPARADARAGRTSTACGRPRRTSARCCSGRRLAGRVTTSGRTSRRSTSENWTRVRQLQVRPEDRRPGRRWPPDAADFRGGPGRRGRLGFVPAEGAARPGGSLPSRSVGPMVIDVRSPAARTALSPWSAGRTRS